MKPQIKMVLNKVQNDFFRKIDLQSKTVYYICYRKRSFVSSGSDQRNLLDSQSILQYSLTEAHVQKHCAMPPKKRYNSRFPPVRIKKIMQVNHNL